MVRDGASRLLTMRLRSVVRTPSKKPHPEEARQRRLEGCAAHTPAFPRRTSPEVCKSFALKTRGRREDRVRAAPAVSCAIVHHKKCAHEHTGSAETLRPSLRNGFTAYIALSLVSGLSSHHRPRDALASRELDASIGASGPHDFAVRIDVARLATPTRPPQPAPTSVTCATSPLPGRDGGDFRLIWVRRQVYFCKSEVVVIPGRALARARNPYSQCSCSARNCVTAKTAAQGLWIPGSALRAAPE
jgi:hypothetical protein